MLGVRDIAFYVTIVYWRNIMVVKKISNTSSILLLVLSALFFVSNTVLAEPIFKTTAEATVAANSLGFQKINETVHGQAVYKKGRQYITRDVDGHNGGACNIKEYQGVSQLDI